jgi:hypothetical protein
MTPATCSPGTEWTGSPLRHDPRAGRPHDGRPVSGRSRRETRHEPTTALDLGWRTAGPRRRATVSNTPTSQHRCRHPRVDLLGRTAPGPASEVRPRRRGWRRRQPLQEPRCDQSAPAPDIRPVGLMPDPRLLIPDNDRPGWSVLTKLTAPDRGTTTKVVWPLVLSTAHLPAGHDARNLLENLGPAGLRQAVDERARK